ncbi:SAM-dependent methyltransferase [Bosea sp. OAE752]|uniref:class I SAM-dependent methyltransferase n=1 Tax=Bosea sp. OAE752 TaxID=2663873 RepID=UPI003D192AE3
MSEGSHEALVGAQFGSRAEAYLHSAVHAQSADLDALAALAKGRDGARVLDLGCGGGHASFNIAPFVGEVVAYDLSSEMLQVVADAAGKRGLRNVVTQQGPAEKLPFADGSFDMVVSRFSAHHWRDVDAGLREAARVLKSGGELVMSDTVAPSNPLADSYFQAIEMLRDCSHGRNYTRAEWEAAVARAGFQAEVATRFRMRLEFKSWVERMNTPKLQVEAIRALQTSVSSAITGYFDTEPDGSFKIEVLLLQAKKAG